MPERWSRKICYHCDRETSVPAYLLGELEQPEKFETHLRQCPHCQTQVYEMRQLLQRMQQLPPVPLSNDLTPTILAQIPAAAWNGPMSRPLAISSHIMRAVLRACLLSFVMACAYWLFYRGGGAQSPKAHNTLTSGKTKIISQALAWLSQTQEHSGSWDTAKWGGSSQNTVGLTGLALLAFVNADDTIVPKRNYHDTITRAVEYLVRQQRRRGYFGPLNSNMLYNHGIATVALLQTYQRCRSLRPRLQRPLQRALDYICNTQNPVGGWSYFGAPANTSISIWQLQALYLADSLGWHKYNKALAKALSFLQMIFHQSGYFGYHQPSDFPYDGTGLTAMASCLLSHSIRISLSLKNTIALRLLALAQQANQQCDYYQYFFLTRALGLLANPQAIHWLHRIQKELMQLQIQVSPYMGSWPPNDRWGRAGGRVYATSLAILALTYQAS